MSRKIFVLVNASVGALLRNDGKPTIISSNSNTILAINGTGEHVAATYAELVDEGYDLSSVSNKTENRDDLHYFKRRAQARRAKASIEASNTFGEAELRIVELGEFDRSVQPVSSWKIEARVSKRTAHITEDGEWFTFVTGESTRNRARRFVKGRKSEDAQRLTRSVHAAQYDYRVVPVYA